MVLGSFFIPANTTKASFFSDLFNNDVLANTNIADGNIDTNSQNIGLLQANVSSATVIKDKKDKNSKDEKVDESKDVNIVSDNALVPSVGLSGADGTDEISYDLSVYVVRKGDSISQVADMFNVTVDTIRWSNDIKVGQKLAEGDVLFIPPVSGLIHTVAKGQTINSIAKLYKVDASDITDFNDIPEDGKLEAGDELIIPGGEKIDVSSKKTTPKINTKNKDYYKKYAGNDLGGYFTNPVPQYVKVTQRLHGKNGTDLAAPIGTPIVASAGGTVLLARVGYSGGYGNMVVINHPNGTQTLYGHLSKIGTRTGATVSKGEIIGYMGSTGRSTGSHLHFEVHGARNSTVDLPTFRK